MSINLLAKDHEELAERFASDLYAVDTSADDELANDAVAGSSGQQ